MGRSRRSAPARPAPRAAPRPAPARAPAPAPAPQHAAPPPAHHQQSSGGGMMSGLMGTVAQGMAFGTGSAIAHRAVGAAANAISGGGSSEAPQEQAHEQQQQYAQPPQQPVCYNDQKSFMDCLNAHQNDIGACQFYLDALNQCKQQSQYM